MEKTEFKLTNQQVRVGYKCDCCKKETDEYCLPDNWYSFDSEESMLYECDNIETYHVCSVECYKRKFIEISKIGFDGEIDNKPMEFALLLAESFEKEKIS